jgi:hypothetical protein
LTELRLATGLRPINYTHRGIFLRVFLHDNSPSYSQASPWPRTSFGTFCLGFMKRQKESQAPDSDSDDGSRRVSKSRKAQSEASPNKEEEQQPLACISAVPVDEPLAWLSAPWPPATRDKMALQLGAHIREMDPEFPLAVLTPLLTCTEEGTKRLCTSYTKLHYATRGCADDTLTRFTPSLCEAVGVFGDLAASRCVLSTVYCVCNCCVTCNCV